jgi:hypothetical protein
MDPAVRVRDFCGNALKAGDAVVWFACRSTMGEPTLATIEAIEAIEVPQIRLVFYECYASASDPSQMLTRVARSPWLPPCNVLLPAACWDAC